MSATSTVQRLARGIAEAKKAANFCVTGVLPIRDPGLEVMQTGEVNLPLTRKATKELIAQCRVAPYGKGTQTLVNPKVRKTFELDPQQFCLSAEWAGADALICSAARQ